MGARIRNPERGGTSTAQGEVRDALGTQDNCPQATTAERVEAGSEASD
jgi:hypothetical protein